jgi:hypothetical protein
MRSSSFDFDISGERYGGVWCLGSGSVRNGCAVIAYDTEPRLLVRHDSPQLKTRRASRAGSGEFRIRSPEGCDSIHEHDACAAALVLRSALGAEYITLCMAY